MVFKVFISSFNIPDLEFVLKEVKGNSMTLGVTDGTNNFGVTGRSFGTPSGLSGWTNSYGKTLETAELTGTSVHISKAYGITLDPTKSGMETDISSNIRYVIKY